jgi:hypothetical protein
MVTLRGFRRTIVWLCLMLVSAGPIPAMACPFCPPSSPTLAEQRASADFVFLCQWVKTTATDDAAATHFSVVQVVKQPDKTAWKKGDPLVLNFLLMSKPGNLFLIFGRGGDEFQDWDLPIEITEIAFEYLRQAPPPSEPAAERLKYYARFLEYPDALIAGDAFAEFGRAKYQDVASVAGMFSREKLRTWLARDNPEKDATAILRRGFYGLVLGLCGNADDAQFLEKVVLRPPRSDEMRLGIDGMMAGYLMLTGPEGLKNMSLAKVANREMPSSETYAFLGALRFLWDYGDERIPRDDLRAAMRGMLERDELAEVAAVDLARWEDWSVMPQLAAAYGKGAWQDEKARRTIIQFAQVCSRQVAADAPADMVTEPVRVARALLKRVETEEPELLKTNRGVLPRSAD